MTFGERLKAFRVERRLSQQAIADELNIYVQVVSRWETNCQKPHFDTLVELSKLLGLTVSDLVGDKEEVPHE